MKGLYGFLTMVGINAGEAHKKAGTDGKK